jgi:hypothetical protein
MHNTKLLKQEIKFYTFDEMYEILEKENHKIDYKHFGINFNERLIISNVLYSNFKIIPNPYTLLVDTTSFDKNRIRIIDYFLNNISERMAKGNKPITIYKDIQTNIVFITWLNKNNLTFPEDIIQARSLFQQYTYSLKFGMKNSEFGQKEAHIRHSASLKLLSHIFNDKESFISSGINVIKNKVNISTHTTPLKDIKHSLNFYYLLFKQIAEFIIYKKDYPFQLKLVNQEICVIPSKFWLNKNKREHALKCFDEKNKRIRTVEEIIQLYGENPKNPAYNIRYNFIKNLELHNKDKRSIERINLAKIALKAYFMHFLAVTGMNDSTASMQKWKDEHKEKKEGYLFSSIKPRAKNKIVEFKINKEFSKEFQQYILIREFLLNGNESDYLFFAGSDNKTSLSVPQRKGSFSSLINTLMLTIDPNLPRLNSKEMRINKISQIIKKDGLNLGIEISQSTKHIVDINYILESNDTTDNEFTSFFDTLNKKIFENNLKDKEISVGHCSKPNTPKYYDNKIENKFIPNCKQQEGCLFCDKFRVIIDKKDIRKLFSLEFLINECRYIAYNKKQFDYIYSPLLKRISDIFENMKLIKPEIIKEIDLIKKDVYDNENLTSYFENKLSMLLEIGYLK